VIALSLIIDNAYMGDASKRTITTIKTADCILSSSGELAGTLISQVNISNVIGMREKISK